MRLIQCLLFVLKRSYICYYIIFMTVRLISVDRTSNFLPEMPSIFVKLDDG